ncbi:hypothetical protein [Azorhizophilus paspali]|uniref:Uncharacterized protein n=1 Tax=Azorhizophilus paspali TaxID=69963 RepID=A0ABV6SP26_AZOPA
MDKSLVNKSSFHTQLIRRLRTGEPLPIDRLVFPRNMDITWLHMSFPQACRRLINTRKIIFSKILHFDLSVDIFSTALGLSQKPDKDPPALPTLPSTTRLVGN